MRSFQLWWKLLVVLYMVEQGMLEVVLWIWLHHYIFYCLYITTNLPYYQKSAKSHIQMGMAGRPKTKYLQDHSKPNKQELFSGYFVQLSNLFAQYLLPDSLIQPNPCIPFVILNLIFCLMTSLPIFTNELQTLINNRNIYSPTAHRIDIFQLRSILIQRGIPIGRRSWFDFPKINHPHLMLSSQHSGKVDNNIKFTTDDKRQGNMKVKTYYLEITLFILFAIELIFSHYIENKSYFWAAAILTALASYIEQGAKFYWILYLLAAAACYWEVKWLEAFFLIVLAYFLKSFSFYHIQILDQSQYKAGYLSLNYKGLDLSVFYPTLQKGRPSKWMIRSDYLKVLHSLTFIDPLKMRVPYPIFYIFCTFLARIELPFEGHASLHVSNPEDPSFPVILFSHGRGTHSNNYSSLCGWWASQGYIVISVQHYHDNIRIEYNEEMVVQRQLMEKIFYVVRNNDLLVRAKEFEFVYDELVNHELIRNIFPAVENIQVQNIHLAGHSYGGATSLETLGNLINKKADLSLLKSTICLDPWLYPLSHHIYEALSDQNILFINSQHFLSMLPPEFGMQKKMQLIRGNNTETLKAFVILGSDHIAPSDYVFVVGNGVQMITQCKNYEHFEHILELHLILIKMFMQGKTIKCCLEATEDFVTERKIDPSKVSVVEEWRYLKDHPN